MSRLVEPKQVSVFGAKGLKTSPAPDTIKDYGERVAKYVPAEILGFYTAAVSLIATADIKTQPQKRLLLFAIVGVFFWVLTPLWLGRFSTVRNVKRTNQYMGFAAFAVWAYAFPTGWFHDMRLYDPLISGLLLIGFTAGSAFVRPK